MSDGVFNPDVNGVVLTGDGGNNVLDGTNLNDQLFGLAGNDRLKGMAGADLLEGGIGDDWLSGGAGTDKLEGGIGKDLLLGGKDRDWLFGGADADALWGGDGNDDLSGGAGNDLLVGGKGNDLLDGGLGNDVIHLGQGSDIVVLAPGNGFDILTDYRDGQDKIQLEGGLTFEDLDIRKHGKFSTEIRIDKPGDPNDGEKLAKLVGIRPNKLTEDDFIFDDGGGSNIAPTITSDGGGDTASISVAENQTTVTDVDATDDTDSEGSGLTYSLSGGADASLFSVDANTGVVTFNNAPDFEVPGDANGNNDYEVQVTVTDSSGLTDVQDLVISVTDVAENAAPTITSSATASVAENQTSAIDVQTSDDTDSEGSGLTYSLSGGADQSLFSVDANTGVVTFNNAPDFEAPGDANGDNAYQVQVTVTDSSGLTDAQDITVNVTDVAENAAPTITSSATASVAENQTSAIDVQTSDDIDSEGSGLTYSLSGGADASLFSVDANTGVVTFNNAPDFEVPGDANGNNDYEVQVTVTDSSGLTDVQDLVISVTDVAENAAPTITSSATASVAENQTSAIDVQTSDDADSEGSGLTYSLSGGADASLFSVDANTGVVTFNNAPDFEAPGDSNGDNAYQVQVTVTDSSGLTDAQDITVNVTDVAENAAPTITSSATASVAENQTSAIDVETSDDTDSEGSGLTYSLSGGADQSLFSIDANTGVVTFNNAPDFEAPGDANGDNNYQVQVSVTDAGGLTDVQDLTVTVTDEVENVDPVAQNQTYSTFGNTVLEVAGADIPGNEATSVTSTTSLLTGATDANGDTLTTLAETKTTTAGGSVTINADGSFFYTPEAGDVSVADTFTFTVLDGNGGSSVGTATINVSSDRIWYVDDDAAAGGDGTSANPFNSLVPLNTGGSSDGLDGAGDTIYVLDGTYTSGITLENNQSLLGQAVDLVVDGTTLITGSNANRPSLSNPGANAITLASGNTVRGLGITGATTQNGIVGTNVGNTLIDNVTFTGLALEAAQLTNSTSNATITLQNNTVNSPNSTTGVELEVISNGASNVTVNVTDNTLSNVSNSAILVDGNGNGTVNTTISGNNITVDNAGSPTIEVDQAGNGTLTALINNNTILGQLNDTDAIFVVANNGTGTLNATITNNSNDTAPTGPIGSGLFGRVQNNNTLNLNIFGNSFVGLNNEDIALARVAIAGANPTLNVTQTDAADLTAVNNNAGLFLDGTINFNQPAPPTP
ncbi:beta strand repeat-containing protein [Leptothoe spongobia]|uniref:Cadherin domain-containing protein n=1 Tax=Leptothoe spongobia TAU-MAC 1115 TaxID=1967444 RepID=A0A947GHI4_9CYAN|nr:cadherin domain-containing protein [Leptothoe spongobia]MBT9314082.1 cadherin domain-containing protein [Leptothoe spongobia TAU-MAC 1115]